MKTVLGQDVWYGWSFYNATVASAPRQTNMGAVFGQWKLEGESPAVFRLIQIPAEGAAPDVVIQLDDVSTAGNWGAERNFGNICPLFNLNAERGRWVDLVVNTNFSPDDNGYLRVWVNGVQKCNYYGRLIARSPGAEGRCRAHRAPGHLCHLDPALGRKPSRASRARR